MTVVDERGTPFCWQSPWALELIRRRAGEEKTDPKVGTILAAYLALTELANEKRARSRIGGDSEPFAPGRERLAAHAGVSARSVDASVKVLERLGLCRVERRRVGQIHLPSRYVLTEPRSAATARPREMTARGGRAAVARGVAQSLRTTTQEELQEENQEAPLSSTSNEEENVWSHYRRTFNLKRSALRTAEREIVEAALEVASPDECCRAIDALAGSEWHRQRGVTTLATVFRKQGESIRSRIDYWLDQAARQEEGVAQVTEYEDDLAVDDVRRQQGLEP